MNYNLLLFVLNIQFIHYLFLNWIDPQDFCFCFEFLHHRFKLINPNSSPSSESTYRGFTMLASHWCACAV